MKADVSRSTFDPQKRYGAVLMQQGRVQLDADWNEQQAIHRHRAETFAADAVGASGTPIDAVSGTATGFAISVVNGRLTIAKGRFYVDGILCLNEATTESDNSIGYEYLSDPLDTGSILSEANRAALVYLEVWERHVTAVDDPDLLEPALDGPDTTTRTQTVWRVKVVGVNLTEERSGAGLCEFDFAAWKAVVDPWSDPSQDGVEPGTLRVEFKEAQGGADAPCLVAPGSGYTGLENQLYRVEIRRGGVVGEDGTASVECVWSRENGSVLTGVTKIEDEQLESGIAKRLTVVSLGRDNEGQRLEQEDTVEVLDDQSELDAAWDRPSGHLFTIKQIVPEELAVVVVGDDEGLAFLSELAEASIGDRHVRLRRWDGVGLVTATELPQRWNVHGWGTAVESIVEPIELEQNLQVRFTPGRYRTGDYWQIPARAGRGPGNSAVQGDVIWPRENGSFRSLPSAAPRHRFCRLALIEPTGNVLDCRRRFPHSTDLVQLHYVGGDGQEFMKTDAGSSLPRPLVVAVMNGKWPVDGAIVHFTIVSETDGVESNGGGLGRSLADANASEMASLPVTTMDGLASVFWSPPADPSTHYVEARLVGSTQPGVRFSASMIEPSGGAATFDKGFVIEGVRLSKNARPLRNDAEVTADELISGIAVTCSEVPALAAVTYPPFTIPPPYNPFSVVPQSLHDWRGSKPPCSVTLGLPYPLTSTDPIPVGFQPLVLASHVSTVGKSIVWMPNEPGTEWLKDEEAQGDLFPPDLPAPRRLPVQLIVCGGSIWAEEDHDLYLDGESFGEPGANGTTALRLERRREDGPTSTGDGWAGGDFRIWCWLVSHHGIGLIPVMRPPFTGPDAPRLLDFAIDRGALQDVLKATLGDDYRPAPTDLTRYVAQRILAQQSEADKAAFQNLVLSTDLLLLPIAAEIQGMLDAVDGVEFAKPADEITDFGSSEDGDDVVVDNVVSRLHGGEQIHIILGTQVTADLLQERTASDEALEGLFDGTFIRI